MKILAFIILSTLVSSCASHSFKQLKQEGQSVEVREKKLPVVFHKQETNQCGPVSLFTITQFFKSPATLEKIKSMAYTPQSDGSHKGDMIAAARRLEFSVYAVNLAQSLSAIEQEQPVLIFQNLGLGWFPRWHYSVLVGYDADQEKVSLHDGKDAYSEMTFKRFGNSWERGGKWAYVVVPAAVIPKVATLEQLLENSNVFIDIQKYNAAFESLKSAKNKWPERYEIYTSLSNLYFLTKDLNSAQDEAVKAIRLKPKMIGLYFNLAFIQLEIGAKDKARTTRDNAMKLASNDEMKELYLKKFKSIGL